MKILIFGNGNLGFEDFLELYAKPLKEALKNPENEFIVGDFRGTDTLTMEFLKTQTAKVRVYHIGEKPRYLPDAFKTQVKNWQIIGGYLSDTARDEAMINSCTHFIGFDFNSDETRKSGTQKNIAKCLSLSKERLF